MKAFRSHDGFGRHTERCSSAGVPPLPIEYSYYKKVKGKKEKEEKEEEEEENDEEEEEEENDEEEEDKEEENDEEEDDIVEISTGDTGIERTSVV